MHVVLVTREVIPLVEGGGIARYVAEAARILAAQDGVDVTILTSSSFAERHARLAAEGDERATPPGVRWAWADEPEGDLTPLWSHHHAWSISCWRAIEALAAQGDPIDVLEFEDYGGAATATIEAKRTGHAALAGATVAVRLHTTWEMTQHLDALPLDAVAARTVMALERHSLAFADRLLAPGERTLEVYRRRYERLARATPAPMPLSVPGSRDDDQPGGDGPLQLLYVGRLQHCKGVEELVSAVLAQEPGTVTLTLAGGDTETAPGGSSMREQLEARAGGDARLRFEGPLPHKDLPELIRAHDVVTVPSHFEAYGYVAREALAENRPVLGTDAGGLADALEREGAGWMVPAGDEAALFDAIARLASDRSQVTELIADGAPRRAIEHELRPGRFADPYRELATGLGARTVSGTASRITAVITLQRGDHDLERTLTSLEEAGQPVEVILAAAAPELVPTAVLGRLHGAAVAEHGEATDLWRAGLAAAVSRGPRLLLRAGDTVSPAFLARGAAALAGDDAPAYVTAHASGRRPACAPLGNFGALLLPELRVEGTVVLAAPAAAASVATPGNGRPLLRLAEEGHYGAVLSERLVGLARPPAPTLNGRATAPAG